MYHCRKDGASSLIVPVIFIITIRLQVKAHVSFFASCYRINSTNFFEINFTSTHTYIIYIITKTRRGITTTRKNKLWHNGRSKTTHSRIWAVVKQLRGMCRCQWKYILLQRTHEWKYMGKIIFLTGVIICIYILSTWILSIWLRYKMFSQFTQIIIPIILSNRI